MYEQLDGILAWGDLIRVGSAGARQPWVPLRRVPKRPRYLNLSLCTPTWTPCTSAWALCTPHVAFQSRSRAVYGTPGPSEALKHCKTHVFYSV